MKKLLASLAVIVGLIAVAEAGELTYSTSVVNATLSVNQNIDLDLQANNIEKATVQVVYSSASPTTTTFTDGVASTGSISIIQANLAGLTTAYAHATITIASNTALAAQAGFDTITVASSSAVALAAATIIIDGKTLTAGTDWTITASTVATAGSIAQAINANLSVVTAVSSNNVVTVTCVNTGTACNSYTIVTSTVALYLGATSTTISNSFSNGVNNAYLTFNGYPLVQGVAWTAQSKSSNTAISIVNALNTAFSSLITSTVTVGQSVIYSTAVSYGSIYNAYTFTSSTQTALLSSSTFVGGQDNAVLKIAGQSITANIDWFPSTTSSATAAGSLRTAIAANPFLNGIVAVSTVNNVVYATATYAGGFANYSLTSSTPAAMTVSGIGSMTGGTDSDITSSITIPTAVYLTGSYAGSYLIPGSMKTQANTIYKSGVLYSTGMAVLLSSTTGSLPSPLVNQTTYYITNAGPSGFQLATTTTTAIAGTAINFQALTQKGGGSFSIAQASAPTGSYTFKFQESNDGSNFYDLYVTTGSATTPFPAAVTFSSPYTASSVMWDFGSIAYRYLRLVYTNGSWSGMNMNYLVHGRKE